MCLVNIYFLNPVLIKLEYNFNLPSKVNSVERSGLGSFNSLHIILELMVTKLQKYELIIYTLEEKLSNKEKRKTCGYLFLFLSIFQQILFKCQL